MSIPTKLWICICALVAALGVGYGYGHHVASVEAKADAQELELSRAGEANQAWAERFALQAQLATRDQQLADSQALAAQKRTVVVVQKEVIYRDKIKGVAVRDCVANSGLLDVYDATLGLSDSAE
jgi:hypothetical protein